MVAAIVDTTSVVATSGKEVYLLDAALVEKCHGGGRLRLLVFLCCLVLLVLIM